MIATEISTDPHNSPARPGEPLEGESSVTTVKVYTRHNRGCSKRERSDWARCNCMKWLYIYRDGKYKLVSAKTRSWERAEQKAREVRDTFDPMRQLQRRLEAQSSLDKSQIDIATAVDQFLKEVARLNRAEATRAKYKLTLARLLKSCAMSILAVEESQKVSMLLSLLYADTPEEQRKIWKELRNHRKKHINLGLDIASSAVIEGTIAPEAAAVALKAKEGPDTDTLEELKQALIYSDCITDAQGLPQWSSPAGISAETDAKRLLESAREAEAHLYPVSEAELRVWKKHMAPVRSSPLKEQLEHMKKCEAELRQLGLPVPTRLQKV